MEEPIYLEHGDLQFLIYSIRMVAQENLLTTGHIEALVTSLGLAHIA